MSGDPRRDGRRAAILALDTATTQAVIAVGAPDGEPLGASMWTAGYRHGETLLPNIGRLLGEANLRKSRLRGIVVGTGPGAFTGLRVGLSTAKGLAHALTLPVVGVPTSDALLAATRDRFGAGPWALLLPAGLADRVLCRAGEPARHLPGGHEPELRRGERLVAVDLPERAPAEALERGAEAIRGLATALLALGAARFRERPGGDDLARLVPEYVTLPRGVHVPAADDAVAVTTEGA
jgi:tRNA threonylcarbamoyl adenosine modification protein YeaZ